MTHFIAGKWVKGEGAAFISQNPATGESVWQGHGASEAQVNEAVDAARTVFPKWAALSFDERVKMVQRFYDLLGEKTDELAGLIAQETGKALWDAKAEAVTTIGKLKFSLKACAERTPDKDTDMGNGLHATLRHRPHGVMAVYGPYNFPTHVPNGHITPALLAGNSVVFKPSELVPMVGEWMSKQWEAADLPAGVFNLLQGEKETGIALANAEINGLLFTGSSATGKLLHKQFAGRPEVLLALELGGNNPLVVHDVADIDAAVHETMLSAYLGTGQRCTCARRLFVTEGAWTEPFLDALLKAMKQLKYGPDVPQDEAFMGPLISAVEADKLIAAQDKLVALGGKVLAPVERLHDSLPFISPGLVDMSEVAANERPDEEYFGPLLQLVRVPDVEAAITEANRTTFGLSAAILCDKRADYECFAKQVRAGILNWNKATVGASGMAPFGGVGCSGNHHPAGYYAADYCAWPTASMEVDALAMPAILPAGYPS